MSRPEKPDDRTIIEMFWRRDERAIAIMEALYGAYCNKIASQLLNDTRDAEECVNSVWLFAWNSIPPQRPESLAYYLGQLTRRASVDILRKNTAKKRGNGEILIELEEIEHKIASSETPETRLEKQELIDAVNMALYQMKQPARDIFIRRYWFMDSVSEIAEKYHMPENRVSKILSRARKKLEEELSGWK